MEKYSGYESKELGKRMNHSKKVSGWTDETFLEIVEIMRNLAPEDVERLKGLLSPQDITNISKFIYAVENNMRIDTQPYSDDATTIINLAVDQGGLKGAAEKLKRLIG